MSKIEEPKLFSYKVENVVATVVTEIEESIDLTIVASKYPDVEYNPERFPGLVMRVISPKATALVFSTGKMVVTGMRSPNESGEVVRQVIQRISKCKIKIKNPVITIQNFVASGDIDCMIDLNMAAVVLNYAMYEPEVFPGLIYRMENPKTVMLLFSTGKVVCTGAKDEESVAKAIEKLYHLVRETDVARTPGEFQDFDEEEEMTFL